MKVWWVFWLIWATGFLIYDLMAHSWLFAIIQAALLGAIWVGWKDVMKEMP